jgi:Uma2 family endonuclease
MGLPQLIAEDTSFEDYLEIEKTSEIKHEYIAGLIYAMAGASRNHNLISGNLFAALHTYLRGSSCTAFMADMLLKLQINNEDIAYYPDLIVDCDNENQEKLFVQHPTVIIEVLSKSTKRIDMREKFFAYQTIDQLQEYIIIKQTEMEVTMYRRASNWQAESFKAEDLLVIPSIKLEISVKDIYERVVFD